jgi:hypothetical protein
MDNFLETCAKEKWIVSMRISFKKAHLALCFALRRLVVFRAIWGCCYVLSPTHFPMYFI